jgi:hypothetical protein
MKNLSLSLGRVTLVLATAFSLGACSRADYAPLSRATTQPASTPIAQATPYVPVASEASATVKAVTPTQSAPAAPLAMQPAPATVEVAPVASAAVSAAPVAAAPQMKATPAPKLNLVQRLALRKVTKQLDKLTAKAPQLKQRDASAARGGIEGNLRSALLFGLIGIILLLFSGVSSVFGILGTILLIIGLVFLVLWLLDQA